MTPIQRRTLIFFAANGVVMTPLAALAVILYVYGQNIEPYVLGPVVAIPKPAAEDIWRGYIVKRETGRQVEVGCLTFRGLRKRADATDPWYTFTVKARLSRKLNVSSYVGDDQHQDTGESIVAHPVGAVWDRTYCFEMPGTIGDEQRLTVEGQAEHTRLIFGRPFPFWRSVTPTPRFPMKPEHCYQVDGAAAVRDETCSDMLDDEP